MSTAEMGELERTYRRMGIKHFVENFLEAIDEELASQRHAKNQGRFEAYCLGLERGRSTAIRLADELGVKLHSARSRVAPEGTHIVDQYSKEFGCTVRSCLGCGALLVGGPTRCGHCAEGKEDG